MIINQENDTVQSMPELTGEISSLYKDAKYLIFEKPVDFKLMIDFAENDTDQRDVFIAGHTIKLQNVFCRRDSALKKPPSARCFQWSL